MSNFWWLQPGWAETPCARCGRRRIGPATADIPMPETIDRAIVSLYRAAECDRIGMVRELYLSEAGDALREAGLPEHAERAEDVHTDGQIWELIGELEAANA